MKDRLMVLVCKLETVDGKAPEWIQVFAKGEGKLVSGEEYLVDEAAYRLVAARFAARGIDLVVDYEHQTLKGIEAPAAGWIKELKWDDSTGIMARVDWTEKGASYVAAREYVYHSPVFVIRGSDKRVVSLHHMALTNWPKTNNQRRLIAAKLGFDDGPDGEDEMLKTLIAKLGMAGDATEEDVLTKVGELVAAKSNTKEVVAKSVLDALGLKETDDEKTVVASIHALNQTATSGVSAEEFNALKDKWAKREAGDLVAAAMTAGKIAPAQKEWAEGYAQTDPEGFQIFVAKAPQVVPVDKLPRKKDEGGEAGHFDEETLSIAASMGNTKEDLEKFAVG